MIYGRAFLAEEKNLRTLESWSYSASVIGSVTEVAEEVAGGFGGLGVDDGALGVRAGAGAAGAGVLVGWVDVDVAGTRE